jgi:4-hydroxy-3-methylbut-2-en-1-yl diphosphate reductase
MLDGGGELRLPVESAAEIGITGQFRGDHLDCDPTSEPLLRRPVHDTHPATADDPFDYVAAKPRSDAQGLRHRHKTRPSASQRDDVRRYPVGRMSGNSTQVPAGPSRVLLAAPRGYCAGVDRAVQTVEHALDLYGEPVYVRKEIVHNKHVVEELEKRGAIFVEEETEVPEGEMVVFSAHGVAPSVHENSKKRRLRTIDATCPLVTKVHVEARKFAADGYTIVLIGHEGHEEVEGTTGEAPERTVLVQTEADVDDLEIDDPDRIAYITQTTLSVDETSSIIAKLKEKFPNAVGPKTDDICYATTNRQQSVRALAKECELVLVIGSTNSSNSNRLVEVAREHGANSHLIDNHGQVDDAWLEGVKTVGITSGASAPEELVEALVTFFRGRGADDVSELKTVHEDVRFMLPSEIRKELAASGA